MSFSPRPSSPQNARVPRRNRRQPPPPPPRKDGRGVVDSCPMWAPVAVGLALFEFLDRRLP